MKKVLAISLISCLLCTGCSTTWLSTFDGYLKIAGPILIQILDIVSLAKGTAPSAALIAKINADQVALNTLAQSVSTASSQNIPSVCAAFNTAVSTFASDLGAVEQVANIGTGTSGEIAAILGIAQAAISEIEVPIASCQASTSNAQALSRLQSASTKITSPSDVVKRFNALVDKKHHVHLHSASVRYLTFGFAK